MKYLLTDDVRRLIESGCSAILATVDANRRPEAERSWGQWVLSNPERLRFLVPSSSTRTVANLRDGGAVAFTCTVIETLQSVQVKGRATLVEPPTRDDGDLQERYLEEFVAAVHAADGTDPATLRNLIPRGFTAVECTVESLFDQTPGPTAGQCLS